MLVSFLSLSKREEFNELKCPRPNRSISAEVNRLADESEIPSDSNVRIQQFSQPNQCRKMGSSIGLASVYAKPSIKPTPLFRQTTDPFEFVRSKR